MTPDQVSTAGAYLDADFGGAGIQAVLDQFLHHGSGALNDLAGGDLAADVVGQALDGRHSLSIRRHS